MLAGSGFLDEAHAAVHLHTDRRDFIADVGAIALDQRCEDFGAGLGAFDAQRRAIDARRSIIKQGPCRLCQRLGPQQHAAYVGMFDYRDRGLVAAACTCGLNALRRELAGLLGCPLGDLHALRADIDTGIVHHREHRLHAAKFAADHLANTLVLLAISHDAGR